MPKLHSVTDDVPAVLRSHAEPDPAGAIDALIDITATLGELRAALHAAGWCARWDASGKMVIARREPL